MGNFLTYICSDTEFLQILKQIKIIEDQFYLINKNSVVSLKLEEKFEKLINKLKNPNSNNTNEIIAESKEVLRKLLKIYIFILVILLRIKIFVINKRKLNF